MEAVFLDSILRSVNGASLHHFSGMRRNDGIIKIPKLPTMLSQI
jgi:hypothetical protein